MTGISGIETSIQICRLYEDSKIKRPVIIGQSGDKNEELDENCKKAGMDTNILKPFSLSFFNGILCQYGIIPS